MKEEALKVIEDVLAQGSCGVYLPEEKHIYLLVDKLDVPWKCIITTLD